MTTIRVECAVCTTTADLPAGALLLTLAFAEMFYFLALTPLQRWTGGDSDDDYDESFPAFTERVDAAAHRERLAGEHVQGEQRLERSHAASSHDHARTRAAVGPSHGHTSSGSISIAPQGHSCAQMPQPLQ